MNPVEYIRWITPKILADNPEKIYLFGDNLERVGLGGQAAVMRYKPNTIGIATKKAPGSWESDYFTDEEYAWNCKVLDSEFARIPPGRTVVIPEAGLGTGLSEMPTRCPKTFAYLLSKIEQLQRND